MSILGIEYAPVIRYGMPDPRDGLAAYEHFWNIEIDRLDKAYTTPSGVWIPGNYYFYLNYGTIMGFPHSGGARKIPMHPIYRDGDHEIFQFLHDCRYSDKPSGAILPKGRRRGYSWIADHLILHEFMMYENVQVAVGSQGQTDQGYVKEFRSKFDLSWAALPNELRPALGAEDNSDMLRSAYKEKIDGQSQLLGLNSIIHWVNFQNPDKLRGLSLSMGIWEEGGQIMNLLKSYLSTIDCFKEGDQMFGLPIIGGTSNKISNDNTDFQEMCNNPERYNLRCLPLYADKCYYPMYDPKTGISDKEGARKLHEDNLAKKKKGVDGTEDQKNSMAYWSYKQEYPLEWNDFWLVFGNTKFPLDLLNDQIAFLSTSAKQKALCIRGELDWPKDKQGMPMVGSMPVWRDDEDGMLLKATDPMPAYKNAFCGAYDPYFLDDELNGQAGQTESKACLMAYKRFVSMGEECEMPAMIYHDRPYLKETVYMYAWKMAVYYDMQILAEAGDDEFLRFFIDHGLISRLKARPLAAESPWAQAHNRFGIHMKVYQKTLAESLMDSYIKRNVANIRFILLLKELAKYGIENTDVAMTFGICLIHDYDMSKWLIEERDDVKEDEGFRMPTFVEQNGRIVPTSSLNLQTHSGRTTERGFENRFDYLD